MSDCPHCEETIIPSVQIRPSYDYGLIGGIIWHLTGGRTSINAYLVHTCPKCRGSWKKPYKHISEKGKNHGKMTVLEEDKNA